MAELSATEQLAQVVIRGVAAGKEVEIDGLGVFYPDAARGFRFEPSGLPQVFIAYVREDLKAVERLYEALEAAEFSPWTDARKLREFQYIDLFPDWARGIRRLATMMRREVARRVLAR